MAKTFGLEIITLRRTVYRGIITSLVAQGTWGKFGVLVRHAPMISSLEPGVLKVQESDSRDILAFIGEGFLIVEKGRVVILASSAEMGYEIDVERARASHDRAQKRLSERPSDLDMERAKTSLARALARLKAAGVS